MPAESSAEMKQYAAGAENTELQSKRLKLLRTVGIILVAGMLYACFTTWTGWGIPCFFHLLTGLKCPGCGVSRMVLSLLRGDIAAAYEANAFLFVTLPFLLFELGFEFYRQWNGRKMPKWNEVLLIIYAVGLLLYGVLRNL